MSQRNVYARYVLYVHFVVAEVFAIPMLFFAGRFSDWVNWTIFDPTMTKMLGAALAALGIGSLLAARDPLKHRVIVQTEIVYTALSAIVLLYRLVRFPKATPDFAWVVFGAVVLFFVLFSVTYPKAEAAPPVGASTTEEEPAAAQPEA